MSGTPHHALNVGSIIGPSSSTTSTGTFVSLKVFSRYVLYSSALPSHPTL